MQRNVDRDKTAEWSCPTSIRCHVRLSTNQRQTPLSRIPTTNRDVSVVVVVVFSEPNRQHLPRVFFVDLCRRCFFRVVYRLTSFTPPPKSSKKKRRQKRSTFLLFWFNPVDEEFDDDSFLFKTTTTTKRNTIFWLFKELVVCQSLIIMSWRVVCRDTRVDGYDWRQYFGAL